MTDRWVGGGEHPAGRITRFIACDLDDLGHQESHSGVLLYASGEHGCECEIGYFEGGGSDCCGMVDMK